MKLHNLIAKLNNECRSALDGAIGVCVSNTHYEVEVEHILAKLVSSPDCDVSRILVNTDVDTESFSRFLRDAIDGFQTGNSTTPRLSPRLISVLSEAWTLASIDFAAQRIRSAHFLAVALSDPNLSSDAERAVPALSKLSAARIQTDLHELTAGSTESSEDRFATAQGGAGSDGQVDRFTEDLTRRARDGHLDPVVGRDSEIEQTISILCRKRQNNPLLVGEPGVGKTAIVEALAQRIIAGEVPPDLLGVRILSLDLALLQAGAGVRGEFEERIKTVISEVKSAATPTILFIDEAHTLIGAGGQEGQGDAANLIKPALARGELRTIAATTWAEYKQYLEKDQALERRFRMVSVDEPSEELAVAMVRGWVRTLENHHHTRVLDEAIVQAVKLSARFITGRKLPDKAVSVLDTACARVTLSSSATPQAITAIRRRIEYVDAEASAIKRDSLAGVDGGNRKEELEHISTEAHALLDAESRRWKEELQLNEQIRDSLARLESDQNEGETAKISELRATLQRVQGESPLVFPWVDGGAVAEVVASWTGIPLGRVRSDEVTLTHSLAERLGERIIGQDHALEAIQKRVLASKASLSDPRRPVGVFLLVGPSGVGKTETALAIAELLYGGERNMITINMSEYQEPHTVSGLKGSPPGYVGYGKGGVLTEAVRRRPYSVILLDEIEKAHRDVQELFYQVFDKGQLDDSEGRRVDFRSTMILLTSNAAAERINELCADPETRPGPDGLVKAIGPDLEKVFAPAFLGRLAVVPYYPLSAADIRRIADEKIGQIGARLSQNHGASLDCTSDAIDSIVGGAMKSTAGARYIDHYLASTLTPSVSATVLDAMIEGRQVPNIAVEVGANGELSYTVG